jgi:hypothetical protein
MIVGFGFLPCGMAVYTPTLDFAGAFVRVRLGLEPETP